jgi:hypothetical protein
MCFTGGWTIILHNDQENDCKWRAEANSVKTAVAALNRLLTVPDFSKRAAETQSRIEEEVLTTACNAIESVLQKP